MSSVVANISRRKFGARLDWEVDISLKADLDDEITKCALHAQRWGLCFTDVVRSSVVSSAPSPVDREGQVAPLEVHFLRSVIPFLTIKFLLALCDGTGSRFSLLEID